MKAFTLELEAHRAAFLESLRVRGQSPATLKPVFYTLPRRGVDNERLTTRKKSLALHFGETAFEFKGFPGEPEAWRPRRPGWPVRRGP